MAVFIELAASVGASDSDCAASDSRKNRVTGGIREESEPKEEAPEVVVFPSISRIEDGRHGFVIREKPKSEEEWLEDFDAEPWGRGTRSKCA